MHGRRSQSTGSAVDELGQLHITLAQASTVVRGECYLDLQVGKQLFRSEQRPAGETLGGSEVNLFLSIPI